MENNAGKIDFNVIREAQLGGKESMSSLVKLTKERVFTFLYRATLDYHLSEDLCQDTMLDMIKSIKRLELSGEKSLLAWLFRTAIGKVQHHYRVQGGTRIDRKSLINSETISRVAASSDVDPVRALQSKEAIKTIVDAMAALSVEYRSALTLRCFDQMSYAEIAVVMGGTQFRTKMLIYRARRALKRQLASKGISRSRLLGALGVFASVTALPSKSVSAAYAAGAGSLKVGLPAAVLATMATKFGIIVTSLLVAIGLSTGITLIQQKENPYAFSPSDRDYVLPAVNDTEFAFPSSVIASYSPRGGGFKAVNTDNRDSQPFVATPEQILVGEPPGDKAGLILPRNYWVELGFDGTIVKGPGPDIFITGRGCRDTISVSLTDGAGEIFDLPPIRCNRHCGQYHVIGFDIDPLPLSSEYSAIRIVGLRSWGRHGGFEVCPIRARILRQKLANSNRFHGNTF